MKKVISFLIFCCVALTSYYLLFEADMTWDQNQKKIVPQEENTTEEKFKLNYYIKIKDLPVNVVDKMQNQSIIHRAVSEALEENEEKLKENGYSSSEGVTFVGYDEDEKTGDMKLHFVFGKNQHRLTYDVIDGEPIKYYLTVVTVVEEPE